MPDHAISSDPDVQRQLDRLAAIGPGRDVLGLGRISALCDRLGNPERKLPPVFHVAGTNGKGSTVAFLRAMMEADGKRVHCYTSPHLVRFNERIRISGTLIDDAYLAELLEEVLNHAGDVGASFFEVTTAVAFLAFARNPADATIIETGLGGRLDATNIIADPLICGIASIGIDHEAFLLSPEDNAPTEPLARIGWEKAGIAKPGIPLAVMRNPQPAADAIAAHARSIGAPLIAMQRDWFASEQRGKLQYFDRQGRMYLPLPRLPGAHQVMNAGLAIAMLRHQSTISIANGAYAIAMNSASWPARLQRLGHGPLTAASPDRDYWLDGGHNEDAGAAVGRFFADIDEPVHMIIGMLSNKNPAALLKPLQQKIASIIVVPVPGHEHHDLDAFRRALPRLSDRMSGADSVSDALGLLPADDRPVLICGSLYLAGEVLRENAEMPV